MLEKLPDGHATQGVAASLSRSASPLAQSEQAVEPSDEYVPAAQTLHSVDASSSPSTVPRGHTVHVVSPDALT